jgi:hypothetical protein
MGWRFFEKLYTQFTTMPKNTHQFSAIFSNNYLAPFIKTFQEYNNPQGWAFMGVSVDRKFFKKGVESG